MAEIRNNIFSVCSLAVLLLCLIVYTQSTVAGSIQNVKRELADYTVSQNGAAFDESLLIRNRNELQTNGKPKTNDLMVNNRNFRSIYGVGPKMLQVSRSKVPIAYDLLVKNENDERSKRFDDYGHMRFGKRGGEEQFDDYGHMRFGRSG